MMIRLGGNAIAPLPSDELAEQGSLRNRYKRLVKSIMLFGFAFRRSRSC
jgi:hypothetical protein